MLAYNGRNFGKLREVFGVLWDDALLPWTSTGLVYSDSIGGCGVTVRVRKRDRYIFGEGFEEPLRPSRDIVVLHVGGVGVRVGLELGWS